MGRGPALWPGVCPSRWPLPAPPPAPCSGTPGGLRLSCWNPVPWAAWGPTCKCTPNTHTPRRGTCMGHEHTPQPRHQHSSPKCQPWSRTLCPRELGAVWEGTEGPELPPRRGLSRKGTSPGDTAVAEQWLRGPLGQATGRHFLSLGSACPAGHTGSLAAALITSSACCGLSCSGHSSQRERGGSEVAERCQPPLLLESSS